MAIPENYIDKITKDGDSRDICPSADKVRVNNANYEGTDLDSVLDEVATSEAGKVDKVTGKGLSTNDYTTAEKNKLAGLSNYDDTALDARVADLEGRKRYFIELEHDNQGNPMLEDQDGNFLTAAEFIALMQRPDLHEVQMYYQMRVYYFDIRYDQGDGWRFWAVESARKRYMNVERNDETDFGLTFEIVNDMINASDIETGLEDQFMTQSEKDKLGGIAAGAQVNVKADWNASSGDAQILNKPTIPAAQVQSDWNAASGMGAILNKPTIPTKVSDLTNDSGFINKAMFYGTCTTAAATMPKVCSVETFDTTTTGGVTHAKDGTIIAVKFTNSDTNTSDAPTLNVNNIGAKAIMYNNAIVTSTAKNTTVAGTAKMLAYYRYDSSLDDGNGAWEYLGKSVDTNSTYSNASLGQGYGVQSNSAAATAITASISSYALTAGGIVSIKFTYDVPANATLNISSKGAKAIYNQGAPIGAGVIKAGDVATFIYSTYYHLIAVDSWQDKQDAINDLADIRSGAALGATALQSFTETDPTVPAWAKASTKPTYTATEVGALPNTTTIPTKVSDLTNDSGFITGYTETDPVFVASAAHGISSADISSWDAKADPVTIVTVSTTGAVTQALDPNKFYNFTGSPTSLTLTLTSGTGLCIYAGKFTAGTGFSNLSFPASVKVADGAPSVEAGGVYEFSVLDNLLLLAKEGE